MTNTPAPTPSDDIVGTIDQTPVGSGLGGKTNKNVVTTSWEDETVKAYDFDLYKGRKNVTDRIGVLMAEKITYGRVHFSEGLGYFICHSDWKLVGGQEVCTTVAPCCEHLQAPNKRFAVLIIQYNTTPQGGLIQPFGYQLKLWRFSDSKYVELRELNKEWPLKDHDLKLLCEDDQYQRIKIQVCKDRVVNNDAFKQKYGAEVDQWIRASIPRISVAKEYTAKELLEKLGMSQAPSVVQQTAAVEDIKDLLAD